MMMIMKGIERETSKEKGGRRKKRWLACEGQDLFFIYVEHSSGGVETSIRDKHILLR